MSAVERGIMLVAVLGLIAAAALSGVWMKKPDKKDKEASGRGDVNVYVIVPPAPQQAAPAPAAIPDAKRYPL